MIYMYFFIVFFLTLHLTASYFMFKQISQRRFSEEAVIILDEVRDTKKSINKVLDRKKPGPKPKKIKEKLHESADADLGKVA